MKNEKLEVTVSGPAGKYWQGQAISVSCVNKLGPLDILAEHENFISLIFEKVVIWDTNAKKHEIPLAKGLLEVSENRVNVFVGI